MIKLIKLFFIGMIIATIWMAIAPEKKYFLDEEAALRLNNYEFQKRIDTPEEIYQNYCMGCHDSGQAYAPVRGNKRMWQIRGTDEKMLENIIKGIGGMPPKGLCFQCTNEDLLNVIKYMKDTPIEDNSKGNRRR